jgi:crossover junction endodeoxyribonuclease RusA
MTAIMAKNQKIPRLEKVRIRVYYRPPDNRRRDSSNVTFPSSKAAIDGLTDAGVLRDDNDKVVRELVLLPDDQVVRGGQLVIEIEEM